MKVRTQEVNGEITGRREEEAGKMKGCESMSGMMREGRREGGKEGREGEADKRRRMMWK